MGEEQNKAAIAKWITGACGAGLLGFVGFFGNHFLTQIDENRKTNEELNRSILGLNSTITTLSTAYTSKTERLDEKIVDVEDSVQELKTDLSKRLDRIEDKINK